MATHTFNYKTLSCFNRKFTITEPGPPRDVAQAFSAFAAGSPSMSADHLLRFLTDHQCELDLTAQDSDRILRSFLQSRKPADHAAAGLTVDDFFHFLLLDDFSAPLKS